MKSVHIATLHKRHDTRILLKECVSLSEAGFEIVLVVGDGEGDADYNGVKIVDVGRPKGRFASRLIPMWRAARRLRTLSPDVVHFHDAMFLPLAISLAIGGQRIIYDVHEDHPREVMESRFARPLLHIASFGYSVLEWIGARIFTRIVSATPHIATRFPELKTITVQNFPLLQELVAADQVSYPSRSAQFTYVGGISANRGIQEMVDAMVTLPREDAVLALAGSFATISLHKEMERRQGWRRVTFWNWLSRVGVADLLGSSRAGLVLFHPLPNNMAGQPNKLFEYMSAGLPVIASDFPLWRRIVEDANCGLLVNPLDPTAIAAAMAWVLDHPEEAEQMGKNGRQAVLNTYNWDHEAEKLIYVYTSLQHDSSDADEHGPILDSTNGNTD